MTIRVKQELLVLLVAFLMVVAAGLLIAGLRMARLDPVGAADGGTNKKPPSTSNDHTSNPPPR